MRLALAGKGGVGKTTIASAVARLAARAGRPVVAVDADSNPNLAVALGLAPERVTALQALPADLVSRRQTGPLLREPVAAVLDHHAVAAPDGVRLLIMGMPGHADEGCQCSGHATVSALLGDLGADDETLTVVDMEASPEHLSRGTARNVDALALVAEPYYRALEAVRHMARLAGELGIPRVEVVGNKVRNPADGQALADFCSRHGLELVATLPYSGLIVDADVRGEALLDAAPDPAILDALTRVGGALLAPTG